MIIFELHLRKSNLKKTALVRNCFAVKILLAVLKTMLADSAGQP
jgi:hypothetical protein